MVRRLKVFLVIMLTLLIGLECLIRANEATFAALADKFLLKEELIEQASDETEIMILGTSRLLDAVDQRVLLRLSRSERDNSRSALTRRLRA